MNRLRNISALAALAAMLLTLCLADVGWADQEEPLAPTAAQGGPLDDAAAQGGPLDDAAAQAAAAGVPDVVLDRVMALAFKHDLERPVAAELVLALARAAQAGLPAEPFAAKMEEGLAKQAPTQRVLAVVQAKMEHYRFAREQTMAALRSWSPQAPQLPDADLVLVAEALASGLDRQELADFLTTAPPTSAHELGQAVEYLAALRQAKLGPALAGSIVKAGLAKGFFVKPNWELAWVVNEAKQRGIADDIIGAEALATMENRKKVKDVCYALGIDVEAVAQIYKSDETAPSATDILRGMGGSGHGGGGGGDGEGSSRDRSRGNC